MAGTVGKRDVQNDSEQDIVAIRTKCAWSVVKGEYVAERRFRPSGMRILAISRFSCAAPWSGTPETPGGVNHLPDASTLEDFFSACYHASMLREEERPVTFRAILAVLAFAPHGRPPEGLQLFDFSHSLPFDPKELRRLSVAADPNRTLIRVCSEGEEGLRIWGLINSGTRWLRDVRGGGARPRRPFRWRRLFTSRLRGASRCTRDTS